MTRTLGTLEDDRLVVFREPSFTGLFAALAHGPVQEPFCRVLSVEMTVVSVPLDARHRRRAWKENA